jgi:hypothetical protein
MGLIPEVSSTELGIKSRSRPPPSIHEVPYSETRSCQGNCGSVLYMGRKSFSARLYHLNLSFNKRMGATTCSLTFETAITGPYTDYIREHGSFGQVCSGPNVPRESRRYTMARRATSHHQAMLKRRLDQLCGQYPCHRSHTTDTNYAPAIK